MMMTMSRDEDDDDEDEEEEEEEDRERRRKRETPNTYALAQTTLKITIDCLCRGPSRRFQGACRFGTHKKTCTTVALFGP